MNDKIKYFIPKVKNRIPGYVAKLYKYLPVIKISHYGIDSISGKGELVGRFDTMLGSSLREILKKANKKEQKVILEHANKAKQHIFDVLGSGPYKMSEINWSYDLKTGFYWPVGVYYLKIRSMTPKGADIKIPWEISRCHHLLWMSEAYCLTNDESYAEEVINQIKHWIQHNPLMYSVNWVCAMDVSIRAVNWIYSLALIGSSTSFTDEFAKQVYRSLYQHLFFVNRNLEKCIPYSNNHYFSNIVGQLFLGQLFSSTRYGRHTFKHAVKEYCKEVNLQILPSGVNYERSISYHRLMAELIMYSYYMLVRIGQKFPNDLMERISCMLGYVSEYTMADCSSPMVSDNDDGRFLPFVPRSFTDHSYLVKKDSLDSRIVSIMCKYLTPAYEGDRSSVHQDANLAILKKDGIYLYMSCFYRWRNDHFTKKFSNTHLHNDLLSFVLADEKSQIIVDPGAYCYTSDFDTWKSFRTARKHNTIIVDNEETNILGNSVFKMKYNANAKPILISSGDIEHCEGEYTTVVGRMTHHRSINLASSYVDITDTLTKQGAGHQAYMSFHFAKGVEAVLKNNKVILYKDGKEYNIILKVPSSAFMRIVDDTISPSFGVLINTKTLIVEFEFTDKASCVTIIQKIKD